MIKLLWNDLLQNLQIKPANYLHPTSKNCKKEENVLLSIAVKKIRYRNMNYR